MLKEVQEAVGAARDEDRQVSWEPSDYQGPWDGPNAHQAPGRC